MVALEAGGVSEGACGSAVAAMTQFCHKGGALQTNGREY